MTQPSLPAASPDAPLDFERMRQRLASFVQGRQWRSLDELADTPAFNEFLQQEFPRQAETMKSLNRRDFLKLLAAPLALAGLSACVPQPMENILPYNQAPEALIPGKPVYFATGFERDGYTQGLVAKSSMGRPIKLEGNPMHPTNQGTTDPFAQASILSLYDPDRAQVVTDRGRIRTWDAFQSAFTAALEAQRPQGGAGLRILTGSIGSPTLASQLRAVLDAFPQARWHQYDPAGNDNALEGSVLAFGQAVETIYRLDQADVILSLDCDFTLTEPGSLRYARDFMSRRVGLAGQENMNRLYQVESVFSTTGAVADHRLPLQARQIETFARQLAARLGVNTGEGGATPELAPAGWLEALAADLQAAQGRSLILAGMKQPPAVHALAHALNAALGNVGQTLFYTDPVIAYPANRMASLRALKDDLSADKVELLLILEGDPAFTAPADFQLQELLPKVPFSAYLGLYPNLTASLAIWHIPAAHFLEMWSDGRAHDGTITIAQPLIAPLYQGRTPHELLAVLLGQTGVTGQDIVQSYWQNQTLVPDFAAEGFERGWRRALHDGVIPNSFLATRQVTPAADLGTNLPPAPTIQAADDLEIVFEPDPSLYDGRFANNAWLQELPKPLTKLTWDNAALINPTTAERLDLNTGDVVRLELEGRSVLAPVFLLPGQPQNSITIHLGYGAEVGGNVLKEHGFNAYALRTSTAPWFASGLKLEKTGRKYPLVTTQDHASMEGRDLVRTATFEQFRQDPESIHGSGHPVGENPPSLYPEVEYPGHAWGMSINLNTCIGCNACMVACQAENNIPVVGKDQVANGREMHWLRVDRYFEGSLDNPTAHFEPLPCMHCEKAPCEPVCPVAATTHSSEGINEMTYSRCVGTRYCSNNCPYKVRRFNFLEYVDEDVIPLKLMRNPDVTVRSRGVMEKCTYCVQRVNAARIQAELEGRPVRDGEVRTACQQACPTQAIIFGDINDTESQVRKLKDQPHNYGLLEQLGTQPRTTYLARLRNPNPDIQA